MGARDRWRQAHTRSKNDKEIKKIVVSATTINMQVFLHHISVLFNTLTINGKKKVKNFICFIK